MSDQHNIGIFTIAPTGVRVFAVAPAADEGYSHFRSDSTSVTADNNTKIDAYINGSNKIFTITMLAKLNWDRFKCDSTMIRGDNLTTTDNSEI